MLQIVGVIFPVMIIALVPTRQYIMPYIFSRHSLHELDAAEYEEAPPISQEEAARETADSTELVSITQTTMNSLCNDCFGSPTTLSLHRIVLTQRDYCSQNIVIDYQWHCPYKSM